MSNEVELMTVPDPVVARFLEALKPELLDSVVSVTRNSPDIGGLTAAWIWLPEEVLSEWEDGPVFNVQVGKYAFGDSD